MQITKLEVKHIVGAGLEIFAHIEGPVNCLVMYNLETRKQFPVVQTPKDPVMLGYEPWIQFTDEEWKRFINTTLNQMVDAWNEKFGKKEKLNVL